MTEQWLRSCKLTVGNDAEELDLGGLRVVFQIRQADLQSPNSMVARVYNLSPATAASITNGVYQRVRLQVGYGGDLGVLFDGTIRQTARGRENPTDTYVDVLGIDGDAGLNIATMNLTVAAGATSKELIDVAARTLEAYGIRPGYTADLGPARLPRGRVFYGMTRDELRLIAASQGCTYSIQNGALQVLPLQGVLPGEAVELNPASGLIGMPERTESGVRVRCLINPRLSIGSRILINQDSVITPVNTDLSPAGEARRENFLSTVPLSANGVYRVFVLEHQGDTRGQAWYSEITALAVGGPIPTPLVQRGAA